MIISIYLKTISSCNYTCISYILFSVTIYTGDFLCVKQKYMYIHEIITFTLEILHFKSILIPEYHYSNLLLNSLS